MFKAFEPSRRKVIKFAARLKAGSLELVIEDNGTGIADADIENIFTMFYSTKEKSIGTGSLGMGLAIARWVMEDCHQGRIRVESRAGKFARFVIELPVAE
jgi:signal transduction histidine kinase